MPAVLPVQCFTPRFHGCQSLQAAGLCNKPGLGAPINARCGKPETAVLRFEAAGTGSFDKRWSASMLSEP
jgi:hypothetical protein